MWDRALSSYILVFDDDWTVRVPGSAGSESPLAIVPAEYAGDEFMVAACTMVRQMRRAKLQI